MRKPARAARVRGTPDDEERSANRSGRELSRQPEVPRAGRPKRKVARRGEGVRGSERRRIGPYDRGDAEYSTRAHNVR